MNNIIEQLKLFAVKIDSVKADERNARLHPAPNLEAIKHSLEHYGQRKPIVVNGETGIIEAGNGLWEAATSLGWDKIAVVKVADDAETATGYAIMDNQSALLADWNYPVLKDLLVGLDTGAFDMDLTGFDSQAIEDLMTQFHTPGEGLTDDDAIPEQVETICKTGDLWQLGSHRLLCGDATKKEDVERLMGGGKADMVFTDPPYGVSVNQGTKADLKARHRRTDGKIVQNDGLTGENLSEFLNIVFGNYYIILKEGGCIYVCHAEALGMDVIFRTAFAHSGFKPAEIIIWVKDQFAFGRQDYHWRHEPIIYGWKEGAGHYFLDDHTQDTVWEYARPKRSESHPTMKPVSLCGKAIRNSSLLGEIVIDLFGGSGSTLIACEKLGRKCFMMEIDEHYCDVIIKRWEDYTGRKAEKL